MAVKRKTKAKPVGETSGFCAYIGPSIRGVIQHGTIYEGLKQDAIKRATLCRAVQMFPMIADLIVPGEMLSDARRKIKTRGNLLSLCYNALMEHAKKEEKTW